MGNTKFKIEFVVLTVTILNDPMSTPLTTTQVEILKFAKENYSEFDECFSESETEEQTCPRCLICALCDHECYMNKPEVTLAEYYKNLLTYIKNYHNISIEDHLLRYVQWMDLIDYGTDNIELSEVISMRIMDMLDQNVDVTHNSCDFIRERLNMHRIPIWTLSAMKSMVSPYYDNIMSQFVAYGLINDNILIKYYQYEAEMVRVRRIKKLIAEFDAGNQHYGEPSAMIEELRKI